MNPSPVLPMFEPLCWVRGLKVEKFPPVSTSIITDLTPTIVTARRNMRRTATITLISSTKDSLSFRFWNSRSNSFSVFSPLCWPSSNSLSLFLAPCMALFNILSTSWKFLHSLLCSVYLTSVLLQPGGWFPVSTYLSSILVTQFTYILSQSRLQTFTFY